MLGFPRALGRQPEFTGVAASPALQNPRSPLGQAEAAGQRGGFKQPAQPSAGSPRHWNYPYAQPPGDHPLKARPSAPDPSMLPHLSHFAAVNETPPTTRTYLRGPDAPAPGSDKKGKKRGRPSKAEYEIRAAEAKARGEPWPPPKKTKLPRTATEDASRFGGPADATTSNIKGGRKQRAKAVPGAALGTGEIPGGQAAGATVTGYAPSPDDGGRLAQTTLTGTTEVPQRSTIPETQASEFPASESLLAELREQAGQSARGAGAEEQAQSPQNLPTQAETAQSSVTLKQESQPQTLPRSNMSHA